MDNTALSGTVYLISALNEESEMVSLCLVQSSSPPLYPQDLTLINYNKPKPSKIFSFFLILEFYRRIF